MMAVNACMIYIGATEMDLIMDDIDKDGSGEVELHEFERWWRAEAKKAKEEQNAKDAEREKAKLEGRDYGCVSK